MERDDQHQQNPLKLEKQLGHRRSILDICHKPIDKKLIQLKKKTLSFLEKKPARAAHMLLLATD